MAALTKARDLLLTPAPTEPAPTMVVEAEPPRSRPQPRTIHYGYESLKEPEAEEWVTRNPKPIGADKTYGGGFMGRIRRLAPSTIVMAVLVFLFAQFVLMGTLRGDDCVGQGARGDYQVVRCTDTSEMQIVERHTGLNAGCDALHTRLVVDGELWCLTPHR